MICSLTNHCLHDWKWETMTLSSTVTLLFGNQQQLAYLPFKHCTIPVYKGFWWADISSRVLSLSNNRTYLPESFCGPATWHDRFKERVVGLPRWGNIFSTHGSVLAINLFVHLGSIGVIFPSILEWDNTVCAQYCHMCHAKSTWLDPQLMMQICRNSSRLQQASGFAPFLGD